VPYGLVRHLGPGVRDGARPSGEGPWRPPGVSGSALTESVLCRDLPGRRRSRNVRSARVKPVKLGPKGLVPQLAIPQVDTR